MFILLYGIGITCLFADDVKKRLEQNLCGKTKEIYHFSFDFIWCLSEFKLRFSDIYIHIFVICLCDQCDEIFVVLVVL